LVWSQEMGRLKSPISMEKKKARGKQCSTQNLEKGLVGNGNQSRHKLWNGENLLLNIEGVGEKGPKRKGNGLNFNDI